MNIKQMVHNPPINYYHCYLKFLKVTYIIVLYSLELIGLFLKYATDARNILSQVDTDLKNLSIKQTSE